MTRRSGEAHTRTHRQKDGGRKEEKKGKNGKAFFFFFPQIPPKTPLAAKDARRCQRGALET